MTLLLTRRPATDGAILSTLFVDGRFECYVLEGAAVAIPLGHYPVTITPSQRFGVLLPLVNDVPGRSGIRIHAGNTEVDTEGCLLVGQDHTTTSVGHSRAALAALQGQLAYALAHGEAVWLDVTDITPDLRA